MGERGVAGGGRQGLGRQEWALGCRAEGTQPRQRSRPVSALRSPSGKHRPLPGLCRPRGCIWRSITILVFDLGGPREDPVGHFHSPRGPKVGAVHFAVLAEAGQDLAGLHGVPPDIVAMSVGGAYGLGGAQVELGHPQSGTGPCPGLQAQLRCSGCWSLVPPALGSGPVCPVSQG